MTIGKLTEYLKKEMHQADNGPFRLKNLTTNKLYCKEEEGMILSHFELFQEGGVRLQLE